MANLDNRISNADQLLTQDVERFCDTIGELYSNICKVCTLYSALVLLVSKFNQNIDWYLYNFRSLSLSLPLSLSLSLSLPLSLSLSLSPPSLSPPLSRTVSSLSLSCSARPGHNSVRLPADRQCWSPRSPHHVGIPSRLGNHPHKVNTSYKK